MFHTRQEAHEEAKNIATKNGVTCKAYQVDTADAEKMEEMVNMVYADIGPVGGIVCNAGVVSPFLVINRYVQINATIF